jgi:hypothetical protein
VTGDPNASLGDSGGVVLLQGRGSVADTISVDSADIDALQSLYDATTAITGTGAILWYMTWSGASARSILTSKDDKCFEQR